MPISKIPLGENNDQKYTIENDCLVLIFKSQSPITPAMSDVTIAGMEACQYINSVR